MSRVSENENTRRLRLLDNCRSRTSTSTISILENLKARISSFREQTKLKGTLSSAKIQEELATLISLSNTSYDEISNNLKLYHRHVSKLNKHIDKVISQTTEHKGVTSLVLPPYECNLTHSAVNHILHSVRNKSR